MKTHQKNILATFPSGTDLATRSADLYKMREAEEVCDHLDGQASPFPPAYTDVLNMKTLFSRGYLCRATTAPQYQSRGPPANSLRCQSMKKGAPIGTPFSVFPLFCALVAKQKHKQHFLEQLPISGGSLQVRNQSSTDRRLFQ